MFGQRNFEIYTFTYKGMLHDNGHRHIRLIGIHTHLQLILLKILPVRWAGCFPFTREMHSYSLLDFFLRQCMSGCSLQYVPWQLSFLIGLRHESKQKEVINVHKTNYVTHVWVS